MGLEVGEEVLWRHHPGRTMEKLSARWSYGLFAGVRVTSNELIIVDQDTKMTGVREDCPTSARKSTMAPREPRMGGDGAVESGTK